VSKGLEEAGDSSVSPLNSDLGESEDVGVEAIEEAVRSPGVFFVLGELPQACFQGHLTERHCDHRESGLGAGILYRVDWGPGRWRQRGGRRARPICRKNAGRG